MDNTLKYIKRTRALFLELVNSLSLAQLNEIPQGFRNNIAWNFGHIVVSTQALCYIRSGVTPQLVVDFIEKYQKGTQPEDFISVEEIETLKAQLFSSIEKIENDIEAGNFKNMVPYKTATYSYEMNTIAEVLTCTLAHDSLHLGYAMAQRKHLTIQ